MKLNNFRNMKTACVYHSIDLDGWMSAAIVKHWFIKEHKDASLDSEGIQNHYISLINNDTLDFIGYNYGQSIPDLLQYDKIIMCDISFPKDEMEKIATSGIGIGNFILLDHHISAIKDVKSNHFGQTIIGIQDTKFAACELTWEYFFPSETMPEIVRLLGRYDCFGHKGTDEERKVLEFQYGARMVISNYDQAYDFLTANINHGNSVCDSIHIDGAAIYRYLCTEAKQVYKNGFEIKFKPIKNKVFLGGTCNKSTWRDRLIPMLRIDYFNPIVEDWTPACQEEEYRQKEECNIHLYVITKEMAGAFSIAEAIDSVHSNKETLFIINPDGFDVGQLKSLQATLDMVINHGGIGKITTDILDIALLVNRLDINTFNETYKFICINKERFNPINFGIDYHKDGYDGCACFHYANGKWNFSLYNDNELVDCSSIAKQYGGGGHKGAAGFIITDINTIINPQMNRF